MKILQINSVCGYGSTGRIAIQLGEYLKENGHECMIAFGRGESKGYSNAYHIGGKYTSMLHGVAARITDRQGFYSKNATKQLLKKIDDFDPDVIHLHNVHGYYLNVPQLFQYLKEKKTPVVWTFHDCWPFTGHCTYFDMAGCDKWKTGCYKCVQKKEYPCSYFADQSKNNYLQKKQLFLGVQNLHIVSPSNWLDHLVGQSFLKDKDHKVIRNGIDLELFKPTESDFREKYHLQDKKILLGVASIWGQRKGLSDFIKLASLIDENKIIVLVGVNDKIASMLPPNIIGIQRTESISQLCEIYSAADVFLNLTYQDNFPTSNIEALACGTPVITYNTGGSIECVQEHCGAVVECGSFDSLLRAIDSEYDFEQCIKRSKDFSLENRWKEYLNLYKEILEQEMC